MKNFKFKTISKKQLADTITPVGMYSKIRDKYANSLLLESSDYHSKEESFTFICVEPIVTLKADKNTFVLNFVAKLSEGYDKISADELKQKYDIADPFFHVPNQLWGHKNHMLLVDALHILKKEWKQISVIATGHPSDLGNSGNYSKLMDEVNRYGLSDSFRMLGIVPYDDLMALMWHSIAIINPSFFEGWSSTVEEAKIMGKKFVFFDIPVHREQNPERGIFVDPKDPETMAKALQKVMDEFDVQEEKVYTQKAMKDFPIRIESFGREYQDIVLKIHREGRSQ